MGTLAELPSPPSIYNLQEPLAPIEKKDKEELKGKKKGGGEPGKGGGETALRRSLKRQLSECLPH